MVGRKPFDSGDDPEREERARFAEQAFADLVLDQEVGDTENNGGGEARWAGGKDTSCAGSSRSWTLLTTAP